jgi:hypothetical protein
MIDLYDRKVTRDEFIAAVAPCINLYGHTSKLHMLDNIHQVFSTGDLDEDRFVKAHEGLTDMVARDVEKVTAVVKRLVECPTSKDKVH